jgi:nitrate reductase NapAB chaperone NapD
LALHCKPIAIARLHRMAHAETRIEIHHADEQGRVVLVIEADTEAEVQRYFERFRAVEGVLAMNLVYHHAESSESLDQLMHRGETVG